MAAKMDLKELWQEKYSAGVVSHDPDLVVIRPADSNSHAAWGTVYYSSAREKYKAEALQKGKNATFDLELMRATHLAEHGDLLIAANPNSLFEGHLVVYPKTKSSELTLQDLREISALAELHPEHIFIHNMDRSAASIVDWAHFQAYSMEFPIENVTSACVFSSSGVTVGRLTSDSPAHALVAESKNIDLIAKWLFNILQLLQNRNNPHGQRIPVNFIWRHEKVWVIARAKGQSELAARYFGGLEMGGIFCMPNADEFRSYLPDALRTEIFRASIASEPAVSDWFESNALRLLEMNL